MKNIAGKMVKAMAAIDAVTKAGRNAKFGYDYVRATDVANEVRKALHESGVAFTYQVLTERFWDSPTSSGGTMFSCSLHIQGVFTDDATGESLTSSAIGWGMDTQDKAPYKAMTGALKYLLRTTFLIPDELDPENEAKETEVRKEVDRQKAASSTLAEVRKDTAAIPPELDWNYQRSSGVLICRVLDAKKMKKKKGEGDVITLQLNNELDKGKKPLVYYFHKTHAEALLGAIGKVCKLVIKQSGDFFNVDDVLEIDGVKMEKPAESAEMKARLMASTLDLDDNDFGLLLKLAGGSWDKALDALQAEKLRRETLEVHA